MATLERKQMVLTTNMAVLTMENGMKMATASLSLLKVTVLGAALGSLIKRIGNHVLKPRLQQYPKALQCFERHWVTSDSVIDGIQKNYQCYSNYGGDDSKNSEFYMVMFPPMLVQRYYFFIYSNKKSLLETSYRNMSQR
ncbi:hypothetical protein HELRODRAFT_183690 [Helobdella robusta]|uniref:Uncharacterized protein n=1 Tax=Helobdella robusta TaxID=6412 RepID=T1FK17_HELRO|nr:hypothetical protein HELRODRAFT_183690 [Helobdella robusta]ESO10366.1 hypothetical protein HELRODRAFT_183690 [Helobdella robusta]